jgi:hypothetical protein
MFYSSLSIPHAHYNIIIIIQGTATQKRQRKNKGKENKLLQRNPPARDLHPLGTPHRLVTPHYLVTASSAGHSLGTVQCNCKLYRSVAVISLPGNLFFARPTNNFFSFSSPPFESDWGRGRPRDASSPGDASSPKGLIPRALFLGKMRIISPVSFELRPLE